MPDTNELTHIQDTIAQLLEQLEIQGSFDVALGEDAVNVLLETTDSGMVIGYHGETLDGLQLLTSLMLSKKLGRFLRVSLEVGDYKKNRSDYLERLAQQTKEKVLAEQREYSLPSLKPWERRVVHMLLQDDTEVTTESIGEGKERVLVIRPRS